MCRRSYHAIHGWRANGDGVVYSPWSATRGLGAKVSRYCKYSYKNGENKSAITVIS
ncbi:MAG: hypothetical protein QOD84_2111 [Acidobacteriaceae bacterium]